MPFDKPITLALKPMKDFDRYGTVIIQPASALPAASENYFSQGFAKNQFPEAIANLTHADAVQVVGFQEKKHCEEGLINGGVYAIDRSGLDLGSLPEKFSFEKEVLEPGAAIREIGGWVSNAYFIDIGIPEDYGKAQWALPAWKAVKEASKAVLKASAQTLFLDRDGVLNRHICPGYVTRWSEWEWLPGVLEELPRWAAKFPRIVLVSNQRGVGKGVMTDEDLSRVHAQMMADILEAGGRIDLALYCTSVSDEDPRRKPNTGMFREAQALFPEIDAKSSVMLGDTQTDAAFAENCGMKFILLTFS
jgi:D-glycero-alpha-D-manno-heptose 1-phosphate guanylyltransferase